jgi:hypothetical protein
MCLLIAFCGVIFLTLQNLSAQWYLSAGTSLSNNDLEISNTSSTPFYPEFNTSSSYSSRELICEHCIVGDGDSGSIWSNDIYKEVSQNKTSTFKLQNLNFKKSTPIYNFAVGYMMLANIRIEGEFKLISSKNSSNSVQSKFNVSSVIDTKTRYFCEGTSTPVLCDENYGSHLNTETTENINYTLNDDLFKVINSSNAKVVDLSSNTNYYFANILYDAPVYKSLGMFAGVGFGYASLKLGLKSNLGINLSGASNYFAYQYKLGTYYDYNKNFRFLISLTNINSIGNVKFSNFNVNPIRQNNIDFNIMYIL